MSAARKPVTVTVYQLKVSLCDITPMIWRRLLVTSDTTIAQLHDMLKTSNLFEVIAGKSILAFRRDDPDDAPPSSKCFALVQSIDTKPKRRLFDLLHAG